MQTAFIDSCRGKAVCTSYFKAPETSLNNVDELALSANRTCAAALRAAAGKRGR